MFLKQTSISFYWHYIWWTFWCIQFIANDDQCSTKCFWTDISWQLPKESNWKCDWQKLNWRAHFLIYHHKRGAEKDKTNWLSLKRPLQQLNRTRNTYNFIFYCFLYGFVLLFLVFLGPYDHLHETLSTSQIRILVKRSTKVINSAFHIKEYFILRVSISFLFAILRNLTQKVKCVFFGVL